MKKWDLKGIADLTRLLGTKTWVCESNPQKRVLLRYGFFLVVPHGFIFFFFPSSPHGTCSRIWVISFLPLSLDSSFFWGRREGVEGVVHSRALVLFPPCSPRLWARKLKVGRVVSVNFARLAHAGWQRRAGERNGPFPRSCSPGPRESVCGAVYHVSRPSRKLPPFPRRRVGVRFFVAFAEPAAGREEALRFGSRGCFCNERAQKNRGGFVCQF